MSSLSDKALCHVLSLLRVCGKDALNMAFGFHGIDLTFPQMHMMLELRFQGLMAVCCAKPRSSSVCQTQNICTGTCTAGLQKPFGQYRDDTKCSWASQ